MDNRLGRVARDGSREDLSRERLRAGLCPICGVNAANFCSLMQRPVSYNHPCCCGECWSAYCKERWDESMKGGPPDKSPWRCKGCPLMVGS